jgi:hypothetical protein
MHTRRAQRENLGATKGVEEMELSNQQMKQLAREIAFAQVTAADDLIDETIESWPDDFKSQVPPVGLESQENRLAKFRVLRKPAAEAAVKLKEEEARTRQLLAEGQRNREARLKKLEEDDKKRHQQEMAQYQANKLQAERLNQRFTQSPPIPPRTGEDVERATSQKHALRTF